MTMSTMQLIFLLGSVSLFASTVYAIHCWDCSSHINPGCGDYFSNNSFAMVDCDQKVKPHLQDQKATLCRKVIQKVQGESRPRIIRSCGWIVDDSVNRGCVRRAGTFSVLIEYCTCDRDGCNGSTSLSASQVATFLAVISCLSVACRLLRISLW